jgi:hypothetical protein
MYLTKLIATPPYLPVHPNCQAPSARLVRPLRNPCLNVPTLPVRPQPLRYQPPMRRRHWRYPVLPDYKVCTYLHIYNPY